MSYQEVSESSLLYVLVIVSLLIIAAICVYYLLLCMRKAKEMGISKQKVNEIIKSTAIFSIVPSIAIAIGSGNVSHRDRHPICMVPPVCDRIGIL